MNTPSARLSIAADGQSAWIRIAGRANCNSSVDFKATLNELLHRGCRWVVLDLSECVLMDSTFLGVLSGFGLKLSGGNGEQAQPGIALFKPSPRILELLDTLGVLHLFNTNPGPLTPPAEDQPIERAPLCPSKTEVSQASMEAHQTLMDINPANVARFKDVAQFLAESLKKSKPE
jgi:anti-sigma B factor antagonist